MTDVCPACGRDAVAVIEVWTPGSEVLAGDVCRDGEDAWPRHLYVHA